MFRLRLRHWAAKRKQRERIQMKSAEPETQQQEDNKGGKRRGGIFHVCKM